MLSDGTVGMLFNDNTKITRDPANSDQLQYIFKTKSKHTGLQVDTF